jgi:hypothetical protein
MQLSTEVYAKVCGHLLAADELLRELASLVPTHAAYEKAQLLAD